MKALAVRIMNLFVFNPWMVSVAAFILFLGAVLMLGLVLGDATLVGVAIADGGGTTPNGPAPGGSGGS